MSTSLRTALVTGAFGFTGSHLARRLLAEGWRVRGLCRPQSRSKAAQLPEVEPVWGDLETQEGLPEAPEGCDTIFHVASVVGTSDAEQAKACILGGTTRLAEAATVHGVRRIVFVSSTGVYGHGPIAHADESHPLRPEDPYGLFKAQAENCLIGMARSDNMELVILRPRLIYGPGDNHFFPTVKEALRRKKVILVNGGRAVNDFIWVDDLVDALVRAAEIKVDPANPPVLNVTSGESVTSREFFEGVADAFDLPRPRVSLPMPLAWPIAAGMTLAQRMTRQRSTAYSPLKRLRLFGHPHHFSIDRARRVLEWEPRVSFREGLERLIR